jgi:hypothetical protein
MGEDDNSPVFCRSSSDLPIIDVPVSVKEATSGLSGGCGRLLGLGSECICSGVEGSDSSTSGSDSIQN